LLRSSSGGNGSAYERTFIESLRPALKHLSQYRIKVAVNAGASDTHGLYQEVVKILDVSGIKLKVAWVDGDSVLSTVTSAQEKGVEFRNICTGERLQDWKFDPIYAHAYLGGLGIAKAFEEGADLVVCGRVSDASPVIGAAVWWHRWTRRHLDELANAFVAGHLIECSTYVCGGNFTGFKSLDAKGWHDIGFPIAEIASDGGVVITKQRNTGGLVSPNTCTSQLLYEIQGPWYFNSDVTAVLDEIRFDQMGPDRVAVKGVKARPPPPTTKVGLTAPGGYQAELRYFLVGLDIVEKSEMLKAQVIHILKPQRHNFSLLDFSLVGSAAENPSNQNAATVEFRILAQAQKQEYLKPALFARPVVDCIMQAYPGATWHLDLRTAFPKPIFEYFVTVLPQDHIHHVVHLDDGRTFKIDPPRADGKESTTYPTQQPSQERTAHPVALTGDTIRGPLGWLVHARSGDKGSNANVGFWVTRDDEYAWLRTLLSVDTVKQLLGDEYTGNKIVSFHISFGIF